MITSKHFKEAEFSNCAPPCSLQDMARDFMSLMDKLRDEAGIPLIIHSAYRPPQWEMRKGRSGTGDHPQGKGMDIRCHTPAERYKILRAAITLGIKRIGIAETYIHIGDGEYLPGEVAWMY